MLENEQCVATFLREARMTAQLNRAVMAIHSNALTVAFLNYTIMATTGIDPRMLANPDSATAALLNHAMPAVNAYRQMMENHLSQATMSRLLSRATVMMIVLLTMRTGSLMCRCIRPCLAIGYGNDVRVAYGLLRECLRIHGFVISRK
jgi:hypothetical protein